MLIQVDVSPPVLGKRSFSNLELNSARILFQEPCKKTENSSLEAVSSLIKTGSVELDLPHCS